MKVGDVENIPESKKEDETWQLMRCEARERESKMSFFKYG